MISSFQTTVHPKWHLNVAEFPLQLVKSKPARQIIERSHEKGLEEINKINVSLNLERIIITMNHINLISLHRVIQRIVTKNEYKHKQDIPTESGVTNNNKGIDDFMIMKCQH